MKLILAFLCSATLFVPGCRNAETDPITAPANDGGSGEARSSPFDLEETEFYTPVRPHADAGGFRIAGQNTTESIRALKEINGVEIEELERRMRPGSSDERGSTDGFLGIDEGLLEVLADDNDFVASRHLTHRDLAIPLLLSHFGHILRRQKT
jgi:hypothetical protein